MAASKANYIHRHKLLMRPLLGYTTPQGNFRGGQNAHIIQRVYSRQKPLITSYIISSPSAKAAAAGLAVFFAAKMAPIWAAGLQQVWQNAAEEAAAFFSDWQGIPVTTWEEYASKWIDDYAGTKIDGITDTEQQWVAGVINGGISEGQSKEEIADSLVSTFDDMSEGNVRTIAMTETTGAFNYASNEIANDMMPGGSTKVWNTTSGNPRPWHEEADGQEVPIDEPFDVDGEDLMYPGDPDGSAENIINCMCVVSYNTPSETDGVE